jgi:hypothetical protein
VKQLVFILLGLAIAVIAWFVLTAFSAALMKQDRARSFANVSLIWNRLDDYRITHGNYPPAQDMTSLLKTLNLSGIRQLHLIGPEGETVLDTSMELTGSAYARARASGFVSSDFLLLRRGEN